MELKYTRKLLANEKNNEYKRIYVSPILFPFFILFLGRTFGKK